jgi:hypothetical protein
MLVYYNKKIVGAICSSVIIRISYLLCLYSEGNSGEDFSNAHLLHNPISVHASIYKKKNTFVISVLTSER